MRRTSRGLWLTVLTLLVVGPARGDEPAPWNILWISAEDMSPDLGCYGDTYAHTPNLDRLAAQGARFTRAFAVAGVCAPSRSGIITGMFPASIGTHHMRSQGVPPPFVKCFPEYLRAAGYFCTNNSKTDYNFPAPRTAWDENGTKAHWRNRPDPKQPFFAVFNLTTSHESQIRASDDDFARLTARLTSAERHDPAQAPLPPIYPDTPVVRRDIARYYDLVTAVDHQVGDLLRQLDEDGLAERTVVFFWGDHGRGLPRYKRWVYDTGIRVPLIVRWPGKVEAGSVREDLVSLIDLGPTVLSIAGLAVPGHLQGRAFLGDGAGPEPPFVFAARDRMDEAVDMIRAVRDRRFKYIRNFQPGKPYAQYIDYMEQMPTMRELRRLNKEGTADGVTQPGKGLAPIPARFFRPEKPTEELYDTEADPFEVDNLADRPEHAGRLETMRRALSRQMERIGDLGLIPEHELRERVRPGGVWSTTAAPVAEIQDDGAVGRLLRLTCPTEGASIAYQLDDGPWRLYSAPFALAKAGRVRAVACRLGFRDSPEVVVDSR